ncbi:TraB/GumN family protein [Sphingomonas sp. MMS24-JH45]
MAGRLQSDALAFFGPFAAPLLALATPACARPAPTQDADPALWVVKDADTTIYLFGTIHVLKPGLTWFDEGVSGVRPVADAGAGDGRARRGDAAARGGGEGVRRRRRAADHAGAGEVSRHADECDEQDRAAADRMGEDAAMVRGGDAVAAPRAGRGYQPTNGPEAVLTAAAKAGGKTVEGLETFEGQLSIFDRLSPPAQVQLLESTMDELPKAGETMATMVADWSRGDPDALAREMNGSLKDLPEVAKALLTDRNRRWAGWIAERMNVGTVFVAGAGHLAGTESVQAMLGAYRLKAVRVKY